MDLAARLPCLGCDRLLVEGELFCLKCGSVPFSTSPDGQYAVVVGPVASMQFRQQAAQVLVEHIKGLVAEDLTQKLAARTTLATGVDLLVGRALVERLGKIPAEAEVVPLSGLVPSLAKRLFGPIPLVLYGAGLAAALVPGIPFLVLLVGLGAGAAVAALRPGQVAPALAHPPQLPPPPAQAQKLVKLLPTLAGSQQAAALDIARTSSGLLMAAHREGLPVQSTEVEGMGKAVSEVIEETVAVAQLAGQEAAAEQRLQEIAQAMRQAAEKLGDNLLPEAPERKLLMEAEVVKEIADLKS